MTKNSLSLAERKKGKMDIHTCSNLEEVSCMREKIYNAMMTHINSYIIEDALRCSARILRFLPHRPLNENIVFVAYGGGKDSSYIVSFVRLIQLLMFREHNTTFRLRIATNRHSGMPFAVMENIDRVYKTLGLYDDSEVELLLVDGNELHPFDVNAPLPQHIKEKNQLDILMTGHRCWGEARPTFCNACNLSMVNSIGLAVSYNGGVDVVVTGDSTRELRAYTVWVRQVATKFGLGEQKDKQSFSSFLHTIGDISSHYFQDIYGKQYNEELQTAHYNRGRLIRNPLFF